MWAVCFGMLWASTTTRLQLADGLASDRTSGPSVSAKTCICRDGLSCCLALDGMRQAALFPIIQFGSHGRLRSSTRRQKDNAVSTCRGSRVSPPCSPKLPQYHPCRKYTRATVSIMVCRAIFRKDIGF